MISWRNIAILLAFGSSVFLCGMAYEHYTTSQIPTLIINKHHCLGSGLRT